jgi:hypothetical protein
MGKVRCDVILAVILDEVIDLLIDVGELLSEFTDDQAKLFSAFRLDRLLYLFDHAGE